VTLAASTLATLGAVSATGRNVSLTAADAELNGNVTAAQIGLVNRSAAANPLRLGDGAGGSGGFALGQSEVNRLNAATVVLDAGTSGGAPQDVAIGALALDADSGANRLDVLGIRRFDVTGAFTAIGTGTRAVRLGGSAAAGTRATTMRVAATPAAGGRLIMGGVDLDLRADRIGVGQDAGFLATLGMTPGGTPASQSLVETAFIANGASTLYVADAFAGGGAYSNMALIRADSLTVRYSDYALFQNTGGSAVNAGAELASLASPSTPSLVLIGSNPPEAGGFAIFGTCRFRSIRWSGRTTNRCSATSAPLASATCRCSRSSAIPTRKAIARARPRRPSHDRRPQAESTGDAARHGPVRGRAGLGQARRRAGYVRARPRRSRRALPRHSLLGRSGDR
jgi:hypothetical protein